MVKKSNYTEEQIALALKQAGLGAPLEEVCRVMRDSPGEFSRRE